MQWIHFLTSGHIGFMYCIAYFKFSKIGIFQESCSTRDLPGECPGFLSLVCSILQCQFLKNPDIFNNTDFLPNSFRAVQRALKSLLLFPSILLDGHWIKTEPNQVKLQEPLHQETFVRFEPADYMLPDHIHNRKDSHKS